MTYDEAVDALATALRFGIHPSLDGIRSLTDVLGRPQDALRCVQVTGTNGKTSVTRMTAALLAAHGESSAAYTSPHLERYSERMEAGGAPVRDEDFARAVEAALLAADEVTAVAGEIAGVAAEPAFTEFELLTAAALWLFREMGVEWACLEVGLGGRWDATSVVDPAVAVVTGVALDHTDRLGETVEEIAADKAQIIKGGGVAVLGEGTRCVDAILAARAAEVGATIVRVGDSRDVTFEAGRSEAGLGVTLDVVGRFGAYRGLALRAPSYQAGNLAVAVAATEAALGRRLDEDAMRAALEALRLPGRFEVMSEDPPVVLDGAHNPQAAAVLADAIREAFRQRPVIVLGVLADKDADGIVAALAPVAAEFVVTQPDSPRALPAAELAPRVAEITGVPVREAPVLADALALARRLSPSGVVVTGSLYTVGEARPLLRR